MQELATPVAPKKDRGWLRMLAVGLIALIGGFAGAAVYYAALPNPGPKGAQGIQGAAGPTGPQGEAGPPGTSSTVDLSKVGLCYSAPTFQATGLFGSGSVNNWVTNVYIYAPSSTNGVLSCGSGSYVPLQPTTLTTP
jgi:hypothetical protein